MKIMYKAFFIDMINLNLNKVHKEKLNCNIACINNIKLKFSSME